MLIGHVLLLVIGHVLLLSAEATTSIGWMAQLPRVLTGCAFRYLLYSAHPDANPCVTNNGNCSALAQCAPNATAAGGVTCTCQAWRQGPGDDCRGDIPGKHKSVAPEP